MWTLLKIWFLGKIVLLTSAPVDIEKNYFLKFERPVSVTTSGANIQIETAETRAEGKLKREGKNAWDVVNALVKKYPEGCISIKLQAENGTFFMLDKVMHTGGARDADPFLFIAASKGLPEGTNFTSMELITKIPLREAEIRWQSYWY